ncbi:hypothetical protein QBC41DRAFT_311937 [Cercophora samala]|uniref:Secreted protein n=1 Tax=Cercophora samala TaxID=330535 RepID=A0AA39ZLI9_9PEZI|nr:hypothetical protein QBC41DRAFT_311937 [Cercophora samala]
MAVWKKLVICLSVCLSFFVRSPRLRPNGPCWPCVFLVGFQNVIAIRVVKLQSKRASDLSSLSDSSCCHRR